MKTTTFSDFTDRILWALLTGAIIIAVNLLKEISSSINQLNERMAVVVEKVTGHEKRIEALELEQHK